MRENEFATVQLDVIHSIQNLVEEMDERNWMRRGTTTIVDARQVLHMAVVWLVQISAIPARLKMHLGTETVLAIGLGHPGLLLAVGAIEASKVHAVGEGTVATRDEYVLLVGSSTLVTGNHTKSRGKWN